MNDALSQNQVNISLKDMESVLCEECESNIFTQSVMLKKVSRFITGQPTDTIATFPVFSCGKCGHINKDFLPKD
jgi:hypothetical protein